MGSSRGSQHSDLEAHVPDALRKQLSSSDIERVTNDADLLLSRVAKYRVSGDDSEPLAVPDTDQHPLGDALCSD